MTRLSLLVGFRAAAALAKNLRTRDSPQDVTAQYLRSGHRS